MKFLTIIPKSGIFIFLLTMSCITQAQTTVNGITQKSYDNALNTYNYTYWDTNFLTSGVATRKFSNHTSSYNLSVNYNTLNINSLTVNTGSLKPADAFQESVNTTFSNPQSGTIDYKILQNGSPLFEKAANPTRQGQKISQMADYGVWLNRRVVDSLVFTNNPAVYGSFTGIEFTNWHNRFKITFHLRPRTSIVNGQLQLSVTLPSVYAAKFNSGEVHGFATNATGNGFAVKGGITAATTTVSGNTITVRTAATSLAANTSYQLSLIFYTVKENFSTAYATTPDDQEDVTLITLQTLPDNKSNAKVTYDKDEGMYYIDVPNYRMGYGSCTTVDLLQNIKVQIRNSKSTDKKIRLCFRQISSLNIVGFSSMIRNPTGDPSGLPLQISKNWHGTTNDMLYAGNWIKEYTELIVPANSNLNFDYTRSGAKWGTVYGAFSHQLSVVGAGVPRGGWLEAGIGSFGENITFSPDYEYGNANVCDYRPFKTINTAYGGTTIANCGWTGNVGGMDMWIYRNPAGTRIYQSQVKTRFNKYGPNLSETSVSAFSSDNKLKLDYTYYLNRSDDFTRVYIKVKIKALEATTFSRFDIFQMGSDNYNLHKAQSVAYGNSDGVIGQFAPTNNTANNYTTSAIALTGSTPWIWAGNGMYTRNYGTDAIETNNGLIIRYYTASFGGQVNNIPYFRERVSSGGSANPGQNPTSYCIVPPPTVNSFAAGDSIELLVETCILPKQIADYYGTNANFYDALTNLGNSWQLLYREARGNTVVAQSPVNTVNNQYPVKVTTLNNTALITLQGGKGYVPVVFSGLTSIVNPKLWREINNSWELVDQTNKGKDFWQAEYNVETGLFDLIFNVNQDIANDATATIRYYLGNSPSDITSVLSPKVAGSKFRIFPNPTRGKVQISSDSEPIQHVNLYNLVGENLTNSARLEGQNTLHASIDLGFLSPGMYIINTNADNTMIVRE